MDEETQRVAEKLAMFVADGGPEVEAIAAQHNQENPAFRLVTVSDIVSRAFHVFIQLYFIVA